MSLPNPGQDAIPFTPLTAEFYDETIENIEALADGTGLDDGAITYAKFLATIFSGELQSYANAGTAGGTFYYINLGGIKILYGKTASKSVGTGGATWGVTFPTSFFSAVRLSMVTLDTLSVEPKQWCYISAVSTSALTIAATSTTNGAAQVNNVLIMGS